MESNLATIREKLHWAIRDNMYEADDALLLAVYVGGVCACAPLDHGGTREVKPLLCLTLAPSISRNGCIVPLPYRLAHRMISAGNAHFTPSA